MAECIPQSSQQSLNHFISDSPWSATEVMDLVSKKVSDRLNGRGHAIGLIFDESGWLKAGKNSVGVVRQYIGQVGKVDNGQVGVFAALCGDGKVGLLQGRLYLPREWAKDKNRCLAAKVPEKDIRYLTKPELAVEIHKTMPISVQYDWVGGDCIYGNSPVLRQHLQSTGTCFVMDIGEDFGIYLEHPQPFIPQKKDGRGRTPTEHKTLSTKIAPKDLIKEIPADQWQTITHRKGTKGDLIRKATIIDVFVWSGGAAPIETLQLIISTEVDGTEVKYSLCYHAERKLELKDALAYQMQRYWVERAFQNAKEHLGMHQYQVRSWIGWYHHIALTLMALDFLLSIQLENQEEVPLLSCADIKLMFAKTLENNMNSQNGLLLAIKNRHIAGRKNTYLIIPRLTK